MTNITLPRATVEQALEALKYLHEEKCNYMRRNNLGDPLRENSARLALPAITALRAALAQQAEPVQDQRCRAEPRSDGDFVCDCKIGECPGRSVEPAQEPVAWRWGYRSVTTGEMDWRGYVEIAAHPNLRSPEIIIEPLYTAPPQRTMVPLTEEEIYHATGHCGVSRCTAINIARVIEEASWEKNK